MLGLSAFAETTFGATAFEDITIVVIVSGSLCGTVSSEPLLIHSVQRSLQQGTR